MDGLIKWLLIAVLIGVLVVLFPAILVFLGAVWAAIVAIGGWIVSHLGTTILWIVIIVLICYIIFD